MKRSFFFWQVIGLGFTSIAGTILHFAFEWCGGNVIIGLFSAVNESIWEHMKLLFFPLFLWALIEYRILGKLHPNFWCVKLCGVLVGLILIPTLFYTYSGILGKSIDIINIAIFYIAAAMVFFLESKILKRGKPHLLYAETSLFMLLVIIGIFVSMTFSPPRLPLFEDPITHTYGYADR